MKVVHLNAYDGNGGAGRACLRLSSALRNQGVDSEVWVNMAFGHHAHTHSFSANPANKLFTAFKIKGEQLLTKPQLKALKVPFSRPVFGRDISNHPAVLQADILHLHWINHAFLTPENIAQLQKLNKPIAWTFHDSNAFTGGCHVRYTCTHFEEECGECPLLKNPSQNDLSHKIRLRKNKAYSGLDLHVIAPSNWMKESVKRSRLMGDKPVHVIPNTLETDVFKPLQPLQLFEPLQPLQPKTTFTLLSGFMPSRLDSHKGTSYLLDALQIFSKMSRINPKNIELKIFGNRGAVDVDCPFRMTFLGVIKNDRELAKVYAEADVFLAPSLEDNLPYTVMESLSCGTPVVAFITGGIPDMVKHQQNGYLATYKSAEDFAAGMSWVYHQPEKETLRKNARETIMDGFSEQVIAKKHIELYQSLLNG